jgi:hypothetical protein
MPLGKLTRNQFYETIVESGLDPVQCNYEETDTKTDGTDSAVITHSSGSKFVMTEKRPFSIFGRKVTSPRALITAEVVDGSDETYRTYWALDSVLPLLRDWATQVKQIIEVPDYWADMKHSGEFITDIQEGDPENTPFTQNEQDEIAAQLQGIKKSLSGRFELSSEQMERIEEKLNEATEASKRMGRKDWLLLFSGTIFNLIVTDIVTPGVAEHIFTMTVHGLMHLFTRGSVPPQVLA